MEDSMSYENPRIELSDTILDIVKKFSEGNPGALRVCCDILEVAPKIDPQDAFKALGTFFALDNLDIYGSKIWMLYKDVCKENYVTMLAVLRAQQLGIITQGDVIHAIGNYGEGLDIPVILQEVRSRLSEFTKEETI
jgi:hypothetical protein